MVIKKRVVDKNFILFVAMAFSFFGFLTLISAAESCGNGLLDTGEECDDGNSIDNDACTNQCKNGNATCQNECNENCPEPNPEPDPECGEDCPIDPRCGDGILQTTNGEFCDDGNKVNGDGCSQFCQVEQQNPPQPFCGDGIVQEGEQCEPANTNICNSQCQFKNLTCSQAKSLGLLTGTITNGTGKVVNRAPQFYEVSLAVYKRIENVSSDGGSGFNLENQTLFDSDTDFVQPFSNLTLSVNLPLCSYQIDIVCGKPLQNFSNGQRYETVINGELSPQLPICGDEEPEPEEPRCGDGIVNQQSEQCDGTNLSGQTCVTKGFSSGVLSCNSQCQFNTSQCTNPPVPVCGNGIKENGEACDVGNQNGVACVPAYGNSCIYCSSSCTNVNLQGAFCGDGVKNTPQEQCDGNSGVGQNQECRQDCTLRNLPFCGNGIKEGTEQCDDGNTNSGDGCSNICKTEVGVEEINIIANKIICEKESDLPNWALGGADIHSETAYNFVRTHPGCYFAKNWSFQWARNDRPNPGNNIGFAGSGWTTFGSTGDDGKAITKVNFSGNESSLWVREVMKPGFIEFSGNSNNNVSAEFYCHTDVVNYDNYDRVEKTQNVKNYFCVAFNVLKQAQPLCGDGIINIPNEECDEGNENGVVCTPSYGSSCNYCSGTCESITVVGGFCGDDIKNGQEQCDGSSGVGQGQSCSEQCTLIEQPQPHCGDGIVQTTNGEQCDPPNTAICNAQCQFKNLTCSQAKNLGLLTGTITNGVGKVVNRAPQFYEVSLAVYKRIENVSSDGGSGFNLENQTLFDSDTGFVQPFSNLTLSVNLPLCSYQIDIVCGKSLQNFSNGQRYETVINGELSPQLPICGDEEPEPEEPRCGDGIINQQSEQCDDGNLITGDGCSSICQVEQVVCEHDVGIRFTYSNGDGTGIAVRPSNNSTGWIMGNPANLSKGQNYTIKYFIDNKIENSSNFIHVVVKADDKTLANYSNSINVFHSKEVSLDISNLSFSEHNITVFVEKVNETDCNMSDNFALRKVLVFAQNVSQNQSICGNSILESGEICDDGNLITGDGCSSICQIEEERECETNADCNDGLFCNGQEACVDFECVSGTSVSCSAFNLSEVNICTNNPDGNPRTLDFAPAFTSVCNEAADSCTTNQSSFTHSCNVNMCGAECELGQSRSISCGTDVGECRSGLINVQCTASCTWEDEIGKACIGKVDPKLEICDGKDNDCDGETDEGLTNGFSRISYSSRNTGDVVSLDGYPVSGDRIDFFHGNIYENNGQFFGDGSVYARATTVNGTKVQLNILIDVTNLISVDCEKIVWRNSGKGTYWVSGQGTQKVKYDYVDVTYHLSTGKMDIVGVGDVDFEMKDIIDNGF